MAIEKTDVVIVGVGAAGGILAAELGKAGMKVIGLERGPRLTTEDFTAHDELRFFQRQDLRPNVKRQPITWRPNANTRADPLPVLNYGNQAGGGSVHYGAVSWRFHEDDFRARSHTIERYGTSAIPGDSSLADWPLSYADLEPYYDRAEYELGVSGKAGNVQGNKIGGGNVFEAPRRREYPLPPLRDDQSGVVFRGAASELGYHPFPTPRAILSEDYQGRPGCTYCGFCQAFGCHVGAKSSILVTKLPEADATGNFKLLTGAMCYRVNSDVGGRVTGVSYYGPGGSDNTIEADLVILSPFIYDNTRLLLLSKTDQFPNGLANSSGQVGKHLTAHMMPNVFVAFDDRYVNVFMGPSAQKHTIDDFNADNFDRGGMSFIRGSQISIGTISLQGGPIGTTTFNPPPGIPRWGAAYRDYLATYFAKQAAMVAQTENLPYADQTIDLDPNVRDQWGLPAPRLTYDCGGRTSSRASSS
jgi:gluconate 2-dehydrogenase alpha chain